MDAGAGTGLLQGAVMGQQRNDQQARLDHQEAMQQYAYQQRATMEQLQQRAIAERQRDQLLQQNLMNLRTQVKDLPDKSAYDQYIAAYNSACNASGFGSMATRSAERCICAPKTDKLAWETLERWQKLPNNKKLLEDHPEQAANAMIPFDRDGDGEPELMRLQDLSVGGGAARAVGGWGRFSNSGTSLEVKANADGILQQLIAKAKAEEATTPELVVTLQKQAITIANQAKPPNPPDPTLQAIRELQLENAKNAPESTLSPQVQRRVDMKTRAFDMQPAVKRAQVMGEAVTFANSLDANTKNPSDDQALIYAFAKAMLRAIFDRGAGRHLTTSRSFQPP